jgi:hypothetical protein
MLLGLLLIVFRPFFPGLAIITGAVLAYYGVSVWAVQPTLESLPYIRLPLILFASFAGLFSSWWSEKLGVRFTYVTQEIGAGIFLGLILPMLVYLQLPWQIGGMFVGATLAMIYVQKRRVQEAALHGPVAVYSMLGPRGFQLLMALFVCDLAIPLVQRIVMPVGLTIGAP